MVTIPLEHHKMPIDRCKQPNTQSANTTTEAIKLQHRQRNINGIVKRFTAPACQLQTKRMPNTSQPRGERIARAPASSSSLSTNQLPFVLQPILPIIASAQCNNPHKIVVYHNRRTNNRE